MLFEPVAYDFGFSDVSERSIGNGIATNKNIDSSFIKFLSSQKFVQFCTGCGNSLACPIRNFCSTQAFRIPVRK